MRTILGRTTLSFMAFICLLAAILGTTIFVTEQQKDDGLIVNLSGRQRMLTQKMTKEVLIYSKHAERDNSAQLSNWEEQVKSTMKVFEVTLLALKDGGAAPLDLQMNKFRQSPPAGNEEILSQLDEVVSLWNPFKANILRVLDSSGRDDAALEYIIGNNVDLLKNMNRAVFLMQYDAERKVALMVKSQIVAIALGIVIVILSLMVLRASVVKPIGSLIEAAESMSKGDLNNDIQSSGMKEISDLAMSLNRMRVSLMKMMQLVKAG